MTTITLTRDDEGKVVGAGEKNAKAWAKFRERLHDLEPGELFTMAHWFDRNQKLHGYHFVVLTAVFEQQEQFENPKAFRMWVEIGAGHADFVPGPKGRMVAMPKSIAIDELDDLDFQAHHEAAIDFLRSPDCTRFLWGHLSDSQQSDMIEAILTECEVKREEIRARRQKGGDETS